MKTRILTGLAFVMMAALNYELATMQGEARSPLFLPFAFVNMVAAFLCYLLVTPSLGFIFALCNMLVMAETVFSYPRVALTEMLYLAFVNIYCTWLPLHMVALRQMAGGAWLLMSVFIMVWLCDSGAYFTGRALGRHKIAPHLSPKKTIDGAAGGIFLTLVAALVLQQFLPLAKDTLGVCLLGLLVAVGAIVGDLFESYLKRSFGVKDSGHILPGHGGFADRFDSFLLVAPLCAYYFSLIQG